MVILLSFLSSTEQQQNNVIIVAALAKVLTSFPYSVQFLKAVETRVSYQDSYRGLYVCIWFLVHSRFRGTLEWLFSGRASVAATLRVIKIWSQCWIWIRGFVGKKKKMFSKESPDDIDKGLRSGCLWLAKVWTTAGRSPSQFPQPFRVEIAALAV